MRSRWAVATSSADTSRAATARAMAVASRRCSGITSGDDTRDAEEPVAGVGGLGQHPLSVQARLRLVLAQRAGVAHRLDPFRVERVDGLGVGEDLLELAREALLLVAGERKAGQACDVFDHGYRDLRHVRHYIACDDGAAVDAPQVRS